MNATNYNGILNKPFPALNNHFGPLSWTCQQDNVSRIIKRVTNTITDYILTN